MIRVNLCRSRLHPEARQRRVLTRLQRLIGRAGDDSLTKDRRVDRRVMRTVLCGQCGSGESWLEACPRCGGYAERLVPSERKRRLAKSHAATKRLMRELEKQRATR